MVRNLEIIWGSFCEILQLEKFEGADFKYDNNAFQILIQNKESLVPNLGIFIFTKILQRDKFEDPDFKDENSFFKILIQKYLIIAFLVLNLAIYVFLKIFCN